MHAEDVIAFLRRNYVPIPGHRTEALETFHADEPPDKYEIIFLHQLGAIAPTLQKKYRADIKEVIGLEPSHLVCGVYTHNNFVERPSASCLLAYRMLPSGRQLELFVYFRPGQMNICARPGYHAFIGDLLIKLITLRTELFLLASGGNLVDFLETSLQFDRILKSTVFQLDPALFGRFQPPVLDSAFKVVSLSDQDLPHRFSDLSAPDLENLGVVSAFYGYNLTLEGVHAKIIQNPHVLAIERSQRAAVAGARANSCQPEFAVVGGVHTLPEYRQQHLGTAVCFSLLQILVTKSEVVALETDLQNFPAQKIYRALGFRPCGQSAFFDMNTNMIQEVIGDRDY